MSKRKPVKKSLELTDRALQDLVSIEVYSADTWGEEVATRYMDDFEAALKRLLENPNLLRTEPRLHDFLYFYRVNKHWLVCDLQPNAIFVLTVMHFRMDITERLIELEPTLMLEVRMLHAQLEKSKKRRR